MKPAKKTRLLKVDEFFYDLKFIYL